ncbi:MAG TPA: FAD-dependent monooxygenase [Casimicrobiaceae bacterium]|nr:FAD-dependent monooxygenase [Casimicrobiaceae bacterium]
MGEARKDLEVLVVGAGPTGLVLALWLSRLGVRVRLIEKLPEPPESSRALVIQARILEHYAQLGFADEIIADGLKLQAVNFWASGRKKGRALFGDAGVGISRFPYALIDPQDAHEYVLIRRLHLSGVEIEWNTELVDFGQTGDGIQATLRRSDGTEQTCDTAYLAGCDGAHSRVREVLHTGFPGGTYAHTFYVADVEATGPVMDRELHVALDEADFLAVFPLKQSGRARLIGTVRQDAAEAKRPMTWDDVSESIVTRMRIAVTRVRWFSTYHVHHRVAKSFRQGRAFLLGDAAHIHSPVGGQGMNTGIGDAVNLAWKLAAVLHEAADATLLDSYEPERVAFAERLVATTDRFFTFVTRDGAIARFVRLHVAPAVIPAAFAIPSFRRFMFRTISQTSINYRACRFNEGSAGKVKGGDRLPWIQLHLDPQRRSDNFVPLANVDWQVHVYGHPSAELTRFCTERHLSLHEFPWRTEMRRGGLSRNALYLVRPDGYVAFAAGDGSPAKLRNYLDARRLSPFAALGEIEHRTGTTVQPQVVPLFDH